MVWDDDVLCSCTGCIGCVRCRLSCCGLLCLWMATGDGSFDAAAALIVHPKVHGIAALLPAARCYLCHSYSHFHFYHC